MKKSSNASSPRNGSPTSRSRPQRGPITARRTGYPKLFRPKQNLAPSIIDTQLGPRRLLYNETELSSNTVEVNNAIQLLKAESSEVKGDGDTGGTRLWWDRKDKGNF